MTRKKIKSQSGKSPERFANKRMLTDKEERWVRGFEYRLYNACAFHLVNRRRSAKNPPEELLLNRFLELRTALNEVMKDLRGTKIGSDVVASELENLGFAKLELAAKRRLQILKLKQTKLGRPGVVKGDIALLICAGLALSKRLDRRCLANEIGRLISENGPLHKRLQSKFGEEAFYSFQFPTINPNEDRWERSSKTALMRAAKEYVVRRPSLRKADLEVAESAFRSTLNSGGYTEYECAVSEYEHYTSENHV